MRLDTIANTVPQYAMEFGHFAADLTLSALPPNVREAAVRVFVDSLAAILVGNREPEIINLRDALLSLGGKGEAIVLGPGFPRAQRGFAALINGAAGPALEIDEGYRLAASHAAIGTVPAALAEAEALHASGSDLALAIVVGYEAAARGARATKFLRPMQPHGIWPAIASSVAIAKLRGATAEHIAAALSVGASFTLFSTRVQKFSGATVRNLWNGLGSQQGFASNEFIDTGLAASPDGLRHTFSVVSGDAFDESTFLKDLGVEFAITRNYHKLYACCGHANAPVEATLSATAGRRFDPSEVEAIEVCTYPAAAELYDQAPINPMAARFSIPWCVSAVVNRGRFSTGESSIESLADEALRTLAQKVSMTTSTVAVDPFSLNRSADVKIKLRSGDVLEGHCKNPRGDFQSPLGNVDIDEKFVQLASPTLGERGAGRVLRTARGLLDVPDVTDLVRQMAECESANVSPEPLPKSPSRAKRTRDYLDELSEFIATTRYGDMPQEARQNAKLILLGDLGAMLRGSANAAVREMSHLQAQRTSLRTATVFGSRPTQSGPLEAAFSNATAASSSGLDEGPLAGHAGICSIAAGLAWAEHAHASYQDLLTALIVGVDVSARFAAATKIARPLNLNGIWPTLGAAITTIKLMGADAATVRETLSLAACATTAGSLGSAFPGTTAGHAYSGRSSYVGLVIALAARAGFTSPLDGPLLMFGSIVGEAFDSHRITDALGTRFAIAQTSVVHGVLRDARPPTEAHLCERFVDAAGPAIADPLALVKLIEACDLQASVADLTRQIRELIGRPEH